ncbi:stress responsive A/B barrel domain-containing protein [Xylaria intraflava]|nr:stress responsive A/B barrel domain-containing protein [Xylaria intraflava]
MAIYHTVMITFKALVPQNEINAACQGLLSLSEKCKHPTTGEPYLKVLGVGKENSIEGLQGEVTHVMVVKFENKKDREYYTHSDPAHLALIPTITPNVRKLQVVDFTPGEF